jgi:hypothetical protein
MLGNRLGEDRGKITGQRVLDATGPKIEVSFSGLIVQILELIGLFL